MMCRVAGKDRRVIDVGAQGQGNAGFPGTPQIVVERLFLGLEELGRIAAADPSPEFQHFSQVMKRLRPHVEKYYENWEDHLGFTPFYTVNTV